MIVYCKAVNGRFERFLQSTVIKAPVKLSLLLIQLLFSSAFLLRFLRYVYMCGQKIVLNISANTEKYYKSLINK